MAEPQLDSDLTKYLQVWPELVPDPMAMQRTALRMNSRMTALRSASADSVGEAQFRFLLTASAAIAVIAYVAWPYIAEFLTASPGFEVVLLCIVVLSLLAPLILLPLLRANSGETLMSLPERGTHHVESSAS